MERTRAIPGLVLVCALFTRGLRYATSPALLRLLSTHCVFMVFSPSPCLLSPQHNVYHKIRLNHYIRCDCFIRLDRSRCVAVCWKNGVFCGGNRCWGLLARFFAWNYFDKFFSICLEKRFSLVYHWSTFSSRRAAPCSTRCCPCGGKRFWISRPDSFSCNIFTYAPSRCPFGTA